MAQCQFQRCVRNRWSRVNPRNSRLQRGGPSETQSGKSFLSNMLLFFIEDPLLFQLENIWGKLIFCPESVES